ncbi:MAG: hypothetical protein RQ966_18425 [Acetobacteraceae bacterium]|nr:hypothetical protein [Acetobacteraceae bacterium]
MSLQTLDRTQWSFAEALAHVQTVTVARRAVEVAKLPPKPAPAYQTWNPPQDPTAGWKAEAETELLVALRDGDLLAQGRYTEERTHGWGNGGSSSGFGLYSGYHTSIRPEQWREGTYSFGRLTARDWEFIDIRVARFLVKAIWPDHVTAVRPSTGTDTVPYTTPYLELMQAAIAKFGITPEDQGKKDCLVDWFLEQQIEGEPVSNKLADAMATLIRLPSAQRGGAKRVLGPDLRQTG